MANHPETPSHDPSVHRALSHDARRRILSLLEAHEVGRTVDQLAGDLGLHRTTVVGHLNVMVDAGLLSHTPEQTGGRGRPRHRYIIGTDVTVQPMGYRLLAEILTDQLSAGTDPSAAAEEAGRRWGRSLVAARDDGATSASDAISQLERLFKLFGFAPTLAAPNEIHLHRCPFADLAAKHENVICPLHRGLVSGVLDSLRAPLTAGALLPWAEPSVCVLHLQDAA